MMMAIFGKQTKRVMRLEGSRIYPFPALVAGSRTVSTKPAKHRVFGFRFSGRLVIHN
jgi:hypothetical protein